MTSVPGRLTGRPTGNVQAQWPTEELSAAYPLADERYDADAIVARAIAPGMKPVIPPKSHYENSRDYDRDLYRLRHLVENAFLNFKQWQSATTRHANRSASFLAICRIQALVVRTKPF